MKTIDWSKNSEFSQELRPHEDSSYGLDPVHDRPIFLVSSPAPSPFEELTARGTTALLLQFAATATNPTREIMVFVNGSTDSITIFEGSDDVESIIGEIPEKGVLISVSKASIESLPVVRITEPGLECQICLSEFEVNAELKQMPCSHKFHSDCINKWLGIRGHVRFVGTRCRRRRKRKKLRVTMKREEQSGFLNKYALPDTTTISLCPLPFENKLSHISSSPPAVDIVQPRSSLVTGSFSRDLSLEADVSESNAGNTGADPEVDQTVPMNLVNQMETTQLLSMVSSPAPPPFEELTARGTTALLLQFAATATNPTREIMVFVNGSTDSITIFEGSDDVESIIGEIPEKGVLISASKSSIESLPVVRITELGLEC
ncbi:unnamed protein product [Fraxinus pennsylvanica]|uniref:RING-type E3 ubiquitin transferase n=1 Tax=Fraxinus pennsylvanica TaxID=56036 RepID=A0AAD2E7X4_9LAMI|nr:unnamed protein product [Fraxinus pennsylvanica]